MVSVDLIGEDGLSQALAAMPAAVQAALTAKAAALAQSVQAHVVLDKLSGQVLQARSGALRASITSAVDGEADRVKARVFSEGDIKYAAIQEFGGHTPAHDIVPDKAKALAFVVGGKAVFATIVHHPGSQIPARSYLRSALADMAGTISDEMNGALIAALAGAIA